METRNVEDVPTSLDDMSRKGTELQTKLMELFEKEVKPLHELVNVPKRLLEPLKTLGEMTMECQYEPQSMQWDVEYAIELFENMTKKERALVDMDGYMPVYRTGTDEVIGRAYISKFTPVGNKGAVPVAEITIIPINESNDGKQVSE